MIYPVDSTIQRQRGDLKEDLSLLNSVAKHLTEENSQP